MPGYEVKLLGPDGHEVADGEEGIMWVRGHSSAPLYWNRPDKTAETIRGEIERSVEPVTQQLELPLGEDRISDVEGEELCSK